MNRVAIAAGFSAALILSAGALSPGTAWAAAAKSADAAKSPEVKGKIKSIDVVNEVVNLEGGTFYVIPAAIKLDDFKAGDQVTIDLDAGDPHEAKAITKAR